MSILNGYADIGRLYGECILYWMLENISDGSDVDDLMMQEGSGLPDTEFKIGMDWLVAQRLVDRPDEDLLQ